jgi:phage-related holin
MLISSIFLYLVDIILGINFISFLPEEFLSLISIKHMGIGSLFGVLFVIFEFLSVLKNMYLCGIPIPASFKKFLEKLLTEMTKEIKE